MLSDINVVLCYVLSQYHTAVSIENSAQAIGKFFLDENCLTYGDGPSKIMLVYQLMVCESLHTTCSFLQTELTFGRKRRKLLAGT
jgi:hypothetical protein